ncbi:AbrB/MazE/SpoVT family DNA-binding domain-containing protein [Candidatus Woesearchaeota archaeon]|nr:AbrB/MazE/SpoVT family DNA-binding domain-containing protein [Candidatus Woesearchaeota archaeon]
MTLAKISRGYQLTIPAEIRNRFGLKPGTDVEIAVEKDRIIITPLDDADIEDVFKRADKFKPHNLSPEDLERMEEELY